MTLKTKRRVVPLMCSFYKMSYTPTLYMNKVTKDDLMAISCTFEGDPPYPHKTWEDYLLWMHEHRVFIGMHFRGKHWDEKEK